ncbi:FecR family protein [Reyranella sp.]|uniref:FecR family protein n=1 Tax=Reyranella sp. TaxID=1929291 RepID=UPI003BABD3A7
MSLRKSCAVFLSVLLPLAFASAASAQQAGVTSAASGDPRGTPPSMPTRTLRVGIDVFGNERVTTGAADRAHLVFLDGSGLTIGANSELVIDKFVFDPNRNVGELAVNATKGALRFVGGAISKKGDVIIRTPSAHIGVRGGIVTVTVGADGSTTATFLFGDRMTVSNAAGTQRAVRYGSQIFVPAAGAAPLEPVILPPNTLQAYLALFEQTQTTGNVIGPGDKVLIESALKTLNAQALPYADPSSKLAPWLAYLQLVATQAITINNASRPVGGAPGPSGGSTGSQTGGGGTGTNPGSGSGGFSNGGSGTGGNGP